MQCDKPSVLQKLCRFFPINTAWLILFLFLAGILILTGVALTGRITTGPTAGPPAGSVTDDRRRRQTTTTDASERNNTGPLGGPVIKLMHAF